QREQLPAGPDPSRRRAVLRMQRIESGEGQRPHLRTRSLNWCHSPAPPFMPTGSPPGSTSPLSSVENTVATRSDTTLKNSSTSTDCPKSDVGARQGSAHPGSKWEPLVCAACGGAAAREGARRRGRVATWEG